MKQKQNIYHKPKFISTANQLPKSLLNASASTTHKAFHGLARHQSDTNEINNRYIDIMDAYKVSTLYSQLLQFTRIAITNLLLQITLSSFEIPVTPAVSVKRMASSMLILSAFVALRGTRTAKPPMP